MPSDYDYAVVGGGALKLKGAKVQKKKKKKNNTKSGKIDLDHTQSPEKNALVKRGESSIEGDSGSREARESSHEDDVDPATYKTESERRYDEVKKKRLQRLAESSSSRPELLKTHKERVEELNTYLSKLSEHHDMPKIGPG
ncbi:hypothetical protein AAL_02893 [Moelleriella libera RCEF 2490]|uniref:DUF1754-domain-containing protein n=1 Tax=Moelleriella libera RCEF 2490 TaxID=1081109 RepID=A0A168E3F0_9HYPO|nr:hypothetical protein AAL_02893 [Moelleriella libera RCEF 2490]